MGPNRLFVVEDERTRKEPPVIELRIGVSLAEAERRLIEATLRHCGEHRERTAAVLGVSIKTLYNRLKRYGRATAPTDFDSVRPDPG